MITIETGKSKIKPILAAIGASVFACAFAVPALALPTTPVSNPSRVLNPYSNNWDRTAPLAGQQFADEDNEAAPYSGEESEHFRHEQAEQEGRETLHHMGEEGEEHAERLKSRVDEERAEHERHEMQEHQPYQEGEHSEDND